MRLPSWALPHAPNWRSSCAALIDQRVKYRAAWYWTHPALNINPRAMVLRCARDDRSSRELITFPPEGRPRPSDTPASGELATVIKRLRAKWAQRRREQREFKAWLKITAKPLW